MGIELWAKRSIGEHTERQLESMKSKRKVRKERKKIISSFLFYFESGKSFLNQVDVYSSDNFLFCRR
jgi:hypothetical protein